MRKEDLILINILINIWEKKILIILTSLMFVIITYALLNITKKPVQYNISTNIKPLSFKKENKLWGKQRVHPKLTLMGRKGFTLQNAIKHYYCKNISDMLIKLDKYSSARALDLLEQKNTENSMKNFRRLFSRFWKCFILRKGYKEKNIGLMIAIMASLYPLLSYAKYLFLKKND